MVLWKLDGSVDSRELYDVSKDSREIPDRDFATAQAEKMKALFENSLLNSKALTPKSLNQKSGAKKSKFPC
jgi:hypothetical protein